MLGPGFEDLYGQGVCRGLFSGPSLDLYLNLIEGGFSAAGWAGGGGRGKIGGHKGEGQLNRRDQGSDAS